jgi:tRNA (guanine37-N1)-methyltransferase
MKFKALTIYPQIFDSYLNEGILKRARDNQLLDFKTYNLRDWSTDNYQSVDDTPYGGGAGMLMRVDIIYRALQDIKKQTKVRKNKRKIILLAAGGKTWNQRLAREYSQLEEVIFVCGRFEGVDARLANFIDEEISVGDYVLTGGELPALTITDSIVRLLPGALGNADSATDESYSEPDTLEYPQYTKPAIFKVGRREYPVPEILLSGNHQKIAAWRKSQRSIKK